MELEQEKLIERDPLEAPGRNGLCRLLSTPVKRTRAVRDRDAEVPNQENLERWGLRPARPVHGGRGQGFLRRMAIPRASRLLDVACGSGQLTLIAAGTVWTRFGVDVAENMIERARERARIEGLTAHFRLADAEALPFADASFDVVASLVGAMFAPRPEG